MKNEKRNKCLKFLKENDFKNLSKEEIKDLYVNKYKLCDRSSNINLRVLNRSLFLSNMKINKEEIKKNKEVLIKELKKVNINYNDLVKNLIVMKEKIKRSNKFKEFELKI